MEAVRQAKYAAVPDCAVCHNPCGRTADFAPEELSRLEPDIWAAKQALLGVAIRYARQSPEPSLPLLTQALFSLGYEWFTQAELEEIIQSIEKEIHA